MNAIDPISQTTQSCKAIENVCWVQVDVNTAGQTLRTCYRRGPVSTWDVSAAGTDFSNMFLDKKYFNMPIGAWDVSRVIHFKNMFKNAVAFDQDIGAWDMSKAVDLDSMFENARTFNSNVGGWTTTALITMVRCFANAESFTYSLEGWDVSNVKDMTSVFENATEFNGQLNSWVTASVESTERMFYNATKFNRPLNNWNVAAVFTMKSMFELAVSFNGNVDNWNPVAAQTMEGMFAGCSVFNGNVATWTALTAVTNMARMFQDCLVFSQALNSQSWIDGTETVTDMSEQFSGAVSFNGLLSMWKTGVVQNMSHMFANAKQYDQSMGNWITTNVLDMSSLFEGALVLNQDISSWNVRKVKSMSSTFKDCPLFNSALQTWEPVAVLSMKKMFMGALAFNQKLQDWSTSLGKVTTMEKMFMGTAFNQALSTWNVVSVMSFDSMFKSTPFNQDISDWPVLDGAMYTDMFRFNVVFQFKANLDTKWKSNAYSYPGTNMFGTVIPANLCLNPLNYENTATCGSGIANAAIQVGNPLYDLQWADLSCSDDGGASFPQGAAPFIHKLAAKCCSKGVEASTNGKSVCANNVVRTGFKASSFSRLCMDPATYADGSSNVVSFQGKSQTCDQHMQSLTGAGTLFADVDWSTFSCGDAADIRSTVASLGALCCTGTGSVTRCETCTKEMGVAPNTAACMCGTTVCTTNEFHPFERFTSSKIRVTAHKGDGTSITSKFTKSIFTPAPGNGPLQFHTKDDGNTVAVDFGRHQEEPIVRAALSILKDNPAAYTVQVEYADDDNKGILGFQNSVGSFAKWDPTFKTGSMDTLGGDESTYSEQSRKWTGGAASGQGMPVSTFAMDQTKSWYVEVEIGHDAGISHTMNVGIHDLSTTDNDFTTTNDFSQTGISVRSDGKLMVKAAGSATATVTAYGEAFVTGSVIGIRYDATTDALWFYKNGKDLGDGVPAVSSVKLILTAAYIFGWSGKNTDTFTLNAGLTEFKRASPRVWTKVVAQVHASSTLQEFISWEAIGAHRYWRIKLSDWTSVNNAHVTDLVLDKGVVTGLYCTKSRNKCHKTARSKFRTLCLNPEKYVGSALVDVREPNAPQYAETCDAHLSKAEWEGVAWASFQCPNTPKFVTALDFMGVAGRCCSDGKTTCWKDYERICSLSGKSVSMEKSVLPSLGKAEKSTVGYMMGCGNML